MATFDALAFAEFLKEGYMNSRFKSQSELALAVGLSRAAVSSLMSAKPQSSTNRPMQPRATNVVKLAKALNLDVDLALLKAGHAPQSDIEAHEILDSVRISFQKTEFSEEDKEAILQTVRRLVTAIRAEKKDND